MTIYVDADACPNLIKTILFKAAQRTEVPLYFLANQLVEVPKLPNIKSIKVAQGFDVADDEIVRRVQAQDLVITSDIPLADEVITKGGLVLSPRGETLSASTIKARLNMRDFLDTLRSSGIQSGGQKPMGEVEKRKFSNALDRYLTEHHKQL
ncbi:MAG: hypothetical protein COC19_00290 [SAR86 cluster bacterium]|uniref:UPF0178 protein COC19_00290 n=1 Tax=SAR86 cluster bacterium TaxID=2030880 RepID=A0A2A4MW19_9GAMM|nr:MAG: hypothetical protein COC19_00290 [SAR86 cluster bacterium]